MLTVSDAEVEDLERKVWGKFELYATHTVKAQHAMRLAEELLKEYHLPTYFDSLNVTLKTVEILQTTRHRPGTGCFVALLHDIGKSKTPVEILDKTYGRAEQYTKEDHEIMKKHSLEGYRICRENGLLFTAYAVANIHRFQKDFYPKDDEMPEYPENWSEGTKLNIKYFSRMVAIADSYLAYHRPNNMHGNVPLTSDEIKNKMLKNNPDQSYVISQLYRENVRGEKVKVFV